MRGGAGSCGAGAGREHLAPQSWLDAPCHPAAGHEGHGGTGAPRQQALGILPPATSRYQKHERGAHLCVFLEEFLENNY